MIESPLRVALRSRPLVDESANTARHLQIPPSGRDQRPGPSSCWRASLPKGANRSTTGRNIEKSSALRSSKRRPLASSGSDSGSGSCGSSSTRPVLPRLRIPPKNRYPQHSQYSSSKKRGRRPPSTDVPSRRPRSTDSSPKKAAMRASASPPVGLGRGAANRPSIARRNQCTRKALKPSSNPPPAASA